MNNVESIWSICPCQRTFWILTTFSRGIFSYLIRLQLFSDNYNTTEGVRGSKGA